MCNSSHKTVWSFRFVARELPGLDARWGGDGGGGEHEFRDLPLTWLF